jgi:hypothetical protein
MTKILRAILALSTIATFEVATAAEGEYYEGLYGNQGSPPDDVHTGTVDGDRGNRRFSNEPPTAIDSGDYWPGPERPR